MMVIRDYSRKLLPPETCRKLPYYRALEYLRHRMEHDISGFPRLRCQLAGRIISSLLPLQEAVGGYNAVVFDDKTDDLVFYRFADIPYGHVWNIDRIGLPERGPVSVDLSQDQFSERLPKITILPAGTDVLKIDQEKTNKQRKLENRDICSWFDLNTYISGLRKDPHMLVLLP
jgi:hypothetical protein